MAERKVGRPGIYGFEDISVGQIVDYPGGAAKIERVRRAALAHARMAGKVFATRKIEGKLLVKRIE